MRRKVNDPSVPPICWPILKQLLNNKKIPSIVHNGIAISNIETKTNLSDPFFSQCTPNISFHASTLPGSQLTGGLGEEEGRSPLPFLKVEKKCPDFRKKFPLCVHVWVKFSFKMQL